MTSSLKKDYLWNTIGVFAQTVISPLLIVVVTRLNGVDDSGLVSFAFAISLIFWAIASWGGRTYQVSDVRREFVQQSYVVVRLILGVIVLGLSSIFCIMNGYDFVKSLVIISLVLFKVLESVADALYGILQIHGRLYVAGMSLLYKSVFGFSLFLFVDLYTGDIFLSSLGFVVANFVILLIYDMPNVAKYEKPQMSIAHFSRYTNEALIVIKRCAPIAAVIFLSMFSLNIPRYFVDIYHESQIGYYGILVMPITVLGLFITFILQPNIVKLTKYFNGEQYKEFSHIVMRLLLAAICLGLIVTIVTYLIGVQLLELIFGIDFSMYKLALMILILGAILNACVMIFMNIFTIMRQFKEQFYILVLTNVTLIVLCISVVKAHGLTGGITLFSLANAIQFILLMYCYKRRMNNVGRYKV